MCHQADSVQIVALLEYKIILPAFFIAGDDFIKAVSNMQGVNEKPAMLQIMSEEQYQNILMKAKEIDLDKENFLRQPDYIISYSEFLFLLSKWN